MKQLTWADAAFVRMESATTPLHVNPVLIYDQSTAPGGRVTFTGLLRTIEDRLDQAPAFRRRLVDTPGKLTAPYWIEDPDFDLEYHVRHIALPEPGDWRQFCIQIARLHARPLDLSRPPWEMTVIERLDNIDGLPSGCFAISLKVHHAAVDGIEGVGLINAIHDLTPEPGEPARPDKPWTPEAPPSGLELLARAAVSGARHPVRIGRVAWNQAPGAVRSAGSGLLKLAAPRPPTVPRTRFNGPVTMHRVFEARFHDFEDIRRIKAAVPKATVNDVALAYVGGTLRHYLTAHGELPDKSLVALCPISIRTPDKLNTGGNMLSAMRQAVGSHIADPMKRLATITASTSANRVARAGVGTPALLDVAELLPGALVGLGMRANVLFTRVGAPLTNTTVTNVPSSRVPLYFAGAKMVRSTGNGPVLHGGGLIHLVSTYAGDFTCAITADRMMMPDPGFYAGCMQRSFTELLEAATS